MKMFAGKHTEGSREIDALARSAHERGLWMGLCLGAWIGAALSVLTNVALELIFR